MDKHQKPNLRRRLAIVGGSTLFAGAAIGGYAALSAPTMHLTAAATQSVKAPAADGTEAAPKGPDTDNQNVQQGGQSGAQDNTPDTVAPAAPEAPAGAPEASGTEADGPGGHTDAAGSAGPDGNFNN